jgi:hypothetical protein
MFWEAEVLMILKVQGQNAMDSKNGWKTWSEEVIWSISRTVSDYRCRVSREVTEWREKADFDNNQIFEGEGFILKFAGGLEIKMTERQGALEFLLLCLINNFIL